MRAVAACLFVAAMIISPGCDSDDDTDVNYFRFYDSIAVGLTRDTVRIYMAAEYPPEYADSIPHSIVRVAEPEDSLKMVFSVFGASVKDERPVAYESVFWRSETLFVWYSGYPYEPEGIVPHEDRSTRSALPTAGVSPAPPPFLRIEDMLITAPENVEVEFHGRVLRPDEL